MDNFKRFFVVFFCVIVNYHLIHREKQLYRVIKEILPSYPNMCTLHFAHISLEIGLIEFFWNHRLGPVKVNHFLVLLISFNSATEIDGTKYL